MTAISAVQMNSNTGERFKTNIGVRQGCLLERIMSNAVEEHDGKVSIGGRTITNLWSVNDIDAPVAGEEQEHEALTISRQKPAQGIQWRYVLKGPN